MTPVLVIDEAGFRTHPVVDILDLLKSDELVQIPPVCRAYIKAVIGIQEDDERASVPSRSTVGQQQKSASTPIRSTANGWKLNRRSGMACCVFWSQL
jgi:hypothetical protein